MLLSLGSLDHFLSVEIDHVGSKHKQERHDEVNHVRRPRRDREAPAGIRSGRCMGISSHISTNDIYHTHLRYSSMSWSTE